MTCIWCQRNFAKLTVEHIQPLCLGGTSEASNIRYACLACNNSRGLVTSYYGNMRALQRQLDRWSARSYRQRRWTLKQIGRFRRHLPRMQAYQQQWIGLEIERLGYSPLAAIMLRAPKGRNINE